MSKTFKYLLPILGLLISQFSFAKNIENCLISAYPDIKTMRENTIYFHNGQTLSVGNISNAPFIQRLKNASVADQLSQVYPLNFLLLQNNMQMLGDLETMPFLRHFMA